MKLLHASPVSQSYRRRSLSCALSALFAGFATLTVFAADPAPPIQSGLGSNGFDFPGLSSGSRGSLRSVLRPAVDLSLSASAPGIVEKIHVPEGQEVKADQVIISLDADEERGNVAQAEASVRGAKAEMERAAAEFERISRLQADNIFSEKQILDAKTEAQLTRSRYEQSLAALDISRARLANRSVVSPVDGIFLKTNKSVGEAVERYETVARVVDVRSLEMVVFCDSRYFSVFKPSQQVQVKVLKSPEDQPIVSGVITHLDPVIDPASGTFRVKIKLERSQDAVSGLTAILLAPNA